MSGRVLFGVALAASLAANAYLWYTHPRAHAAQASDAGLSAPAHGPTAPAPMRLPKLEDGQLERPVHDLDRAALEQKLIRVERRLVELRFPSEKYPLEPRSVESEKRAMFILDAIYGVESAAARPYRLECHGVVCKIGPGIDTAQLQQTFPESGWFEKEFDGGDTYIELPSPDELGKRIFGSLRIAFFISNSTAACIRLHAGRGTLMLDLHFDASTRRFTVTARGTLADQPVGHCLRATLETIVAETAVPPEVTAVPTESIEMTLPAE